MGKYDELGRLIKRRFHKYKRHFLSSSYSVTFTRRNISSSCFRE